MNKLLSIPNDVIEELSINHISEIYGGETDNKSSLVNDGKKCNVINSNTNCSAINQAKNVVLQIIKVHPVPSQIIVETVPLQDMHHFLVAENIIRNNLKKNLLI